jgi:Mn-dependent DtxR family transcriptional regulator
LLWEDPDATSKELAERLSVTTSTVRGYCGASSKFCIHIS